MKTLKKVTSKSSQSVTAFYCPCTSSGSCSACTNQDPWESAANNTANNENDAVPKNFA